MNSRVLLNIYPFEYLRYLLWKKNYPRRRWKVSDFINIQEILSFYSKLCVCANNEASCLTNTTIDQSCLRNTASYVFAAIYFFCLFSRHFKTFKNVCASTLHLSWKRNFLFKLKDAQTFKFWLYFRNSCSYSECCLCTNWKKFRNKGPDVRSPINRSRCISSIVYYL